jgi:hypothetical protein
MYNKNKQIQAQLSNFKPTSISQEIQMAAKSNLIHQSTDEEISAVLRYIFVLIGLRKDLIPSHPDPKTGEDLPKNVLINFIKSRLTNCSLEEIKLSFELAVARKINVDLRLFGDTFSSKTIMDVWAAYCDYKHKLITNIKVEKSSNVYQNTTAVLANLKEDTILHLKNIGAENKIIKEKIEPSDYDLLCQDIMKEFDVLYSNQEQHEGKRFVNYKTKILSIEEFTNLRLLEVLNELK